MDLEKSRVWGVLGRLLDALVALDVLTHTGSYFSVMREQERL